MFSLGQVPSISSIEQCHAHANKERHRTTALLIVDLLTQIKRSNRIDPIMLPLASLLLLLGTVSVWSAPLTGVQPPSSGSAAAAKAKKSLFIRAKPDPHLAARDMLKPDMTKRDVYTNYPYTGPDVPIADWADQTVNGNGKGFPRLNEPPAVWPAAVNPTNNINKIAMAYVPGGMNIHFSTPYGIGGEPCVDYGTDQYNMNTNVKGTTVT